jgi:hypothetical protein
MQYTATDPLDYLSQIPAERVEAMTKLRNICKKELEKLGFEESIFYGMIGYAVPFSTYPDGYHCDPKQPLPFVNIGSQKNFIALYHMGIYNDPKLLSWFTKQRPQHCKRKLDMGKSCIRFKKMDDIPFTLIEELLTKISAIQWINIYEIAIKK